jgi:hypothetical protein
MGLLDDYLAASFRNDARAERARGRSGTLDDMQANAALKRSISSEAQRVLGQATAQLAGELRGLMDEQREHEAAAERNRRAYEAQKESFAELKAKFRASAISGAVTAVREAQLFARQVSEPVECGPLFLKWANVRGFANILRRSGIDDISLLRDVSDAQLLLEQLAPSGGRSLEALLSELTDVVNELYLTVLEMIEFQQTSAMCSHQTRRTRRGNASRRCIRDSTRRSPILSSTTLAARAFTPD